MSLHSGIDTVAWVSLGLFSKTYGDGEQGTLNNLFGSLGLLEDAPVIILYVYALTAWGFGFFKRNKRRQ